MKLNQICVLSLLICSFAFAEGDEKHGDKTGPCKEIVKACEAAGFKKGAAKEGKGLWKNCVQPIVDAEGAKAGTIALPNVDAAVVTACKEKHAKFAEKREHRKEQRKAKKHHD